MGSSPDQLDAPRWMHHDGTLGDRIRGLLSAVYFRQRNNLQTREPRLSSPLIQWQILRILFAIFKHTYNIVPTLTVKN